MAGGLIDLLAPALGIAASPFGVVPAILLLFTASPRANAGAFLGGWAAGIASAFLFAHALAETLAGLGGGPWLGWLRLAAGAALLVLAARQWRNRHAAGVPGWMTRLGGNRPPASARLGLMLSLANPKVLLLAAAGGLGAAALPPRSALAFTLIASLTVALPLLLHLAAGARIMPPLTRARDWLMANGAAITAAVMGLIGASLLLKGA